MTTGGMGWTGLRRLAALAAALGRGGGGCSVRPGPAASLHCPSASSRCPTASRRFKPAHHRENVKVVKETGENTTSVKKGPEHTSAGAGRVCRLLSDSSAPCPLPATPATTPRCHSIHHNKHLLLSIRMRKNYTTRCVCVCVCVCVACGVCVVWDRMESDTGRRLPGVWGLG
jgi:hypothetical protein